MVKYEQYVHCFLHRKHKIDMILYKIKCLIRYNEETKVIFLFIVWSSISKIISIRNLKRILIMFVMRTSKLKMKCLFRWVVTNLIFQLVSIIVEEIKCAEKLMIMFCNHGSSFKLIKFSNSMVYFFAVNFWTLLLWILLSYFLILGYITFLKSNSFLKNYLYKM